ncbi:MAG: YggT family protein [Actinomycetes bacterium]
MGLLGDLLRIYSYVLLLRVLISWFPPSSSGGALAMVQMWLYKLTEPVLAPVRRALPPMGGLDLSAMLVLILVQVLASWLS